MLTPILGALLTGGCFPAARSGHRRAAQIESPKIGHFPKAAVGGLVEVVQGEACDEGIDPSSRFRYGKNLGKEKRNSYHLAQVADLLSGAVIRGS
jgi:hypothetical protein